MSFFPSPLWDTSWISQELSPGFVFAWFLPKSQTTGNCPPTNADLCQPMKSGFYQGMGGWQIPPQALCKKVVRMIQKHSRFQWEPFLHEAKWPERVLSEFKSFLTSFSGRGIGAFRYGEERARKLQGNREGAIWARPNQAPPVTISFNVILKTCRRCVWTNEDILKQLHLFLLYMGGVKTRLLREAPVVCHTRVSKRGETFPDNELCWGCSQWQRNGGVG